MDMDGDGALTAADFAAMLAPGYEALLAAIARGVELDAVYFLRGEEAETE